MAKINDYTFRGVPAEVELFRDEVTALWNHGKDQLAVISIAPAYAGSPGELVVYRNGTDGRLYIYLGSSWNVAVLFTADGS